MIFGNVVGRIAVASLCTVLLAAASPGFAAGKTVSRDFGKPLTEAQRLAGAGQSEQALAQLAVARGKAKNSYEKFLVSETAAAIYTRQRNYGAAADAIETSLGLDQYSGEQRARQINVICQMRFQAHTPDRAVTACTRAMRETGANYSTYALIAQLQYQQHHWAESAAAAKTALKMGGAQDEALVDMLLNIATNQRDFAGQRAAMERLVLMHPSRENWSRLQILVASKLPSKPRLDLDMERIKLATGVSNNANDYMLIGQLALEAGLPGEAQSALKRGVDAKIIGVGEQKDRQNRLIAKANADAAENLKALPTLEKEALAGKDGKKDLQLGQTYVSYKRFDVGIAAIKRALSKGYDAGEGQLRLGQAYFAAGKRADAQRVFEAVPAASPYHVIAELWSIHARASS